MTPGIQASWMIEPFTEMWNIASRGRKRKRRRMKGPFASDSDGPTVYQAFLEYIS